MKYLGFIAPIFMVLHKKSLLINNTYKNFTLLNNNVNIFCKYDFDCKLPYTCHKIFGNFGICKYNKNLIPIPIPIDK